MTTEERDEIVPMIWLTYAWSDNEERDVDYVVQTLERAGLDVNLDRFHIGAGLHLWPQIEAGITAAATGGWAIYATPTSLSSPPCREEMAIALDNALHERGEDFPLIGVLPGPFERSALPALLRTRLCVSTDDPDWVERTVAAVERRRPRIELPEQPSFVAVEHGGRDRLILEVRPRIGEWSPFVAYAPADEVTQFSAMPGPPGAVPFASATGPYRTSEPILDGRLWHFIEVLDPPATPRRSYYLVADARPSEVRFGAPNALELWRR